MITLGGSPTLYENSSAVDAVLTYPSGVAAGDFLVASITVSQQTAPSTAPSGWTLLASRSSVDSRGPAIAVFYKFAAGGESGTVTFSGVQTTAGSLTGIMQRFVGVHPTTPIDVTATSTSTTYATSMTLDSITTATNNAMLLFAVGFMVSSSSDITAPAGVSLISKSTGTGRRAGLWQKTQASAGASGTTLWQSSPSSSNPWSGITMALRPATGGQSVSTAAPRILLSVDMGTPSVVAGRAATVVAVKATGSALAKAPVFTQGVPGQVFVTPATATAVALPVTHNGVVQQANTLSPLHSRTLTLDVVPALTGTLNISHGRTLTSQTTGLNILGSVNISHNRTVTQTGAPAVNASMTLTRYHKYTTASAVPQLAGSLSMTHAATNLGLSGLALIPGRLLRKRCEKHTAFLYDRGGKRQIAALSPLARVKWGRLRDDISSATVTVKAPDPVCAEALAMAEAGRMELVIFRGNLRVWEGPVVRLSYQRDTVEIEAHDVMHYVRRTIMRNEYDNRYPNNGPVLDRLERIFTAEMARWEAVDPAANVLSHMKFIRADGVTSTDAGTAAWTKPYEMTLFQHMDTYAARGGIDYTVIGRSIYVFDTHTKLGQTPMVTRNDFLGDPIISQYGMELATYVAMTDGKGNYGEAGGTDPYYGIWEALFQAYDENAGPAETNQPPSVAEMTSQAKRTWSATKYPPVVVRVPDNSRINPNGVLDITFLVPGTWVPVNAEVPGRNVTQMQKLDNMTVEETPEKGEVITATFSPATKESME